MIKVDTDNSKLAQFIAKKLDDGWVVSGVCMTGPEVDAKTGSAMHGVHIDRGCWRWTDSWSKWRRFFKPPIRFEK